MVFVFYDPRRTESSWIDTACQFLDIAELTYGIVDRNRQVIDPYTSVPVGSIDDMLALSFKFSSGNVLIGVPSDTVPYARNGDKLIHNLTQLFEWLWWEVRTQHDG